jgi:hypothetical protein
MWLGRSCSYYQETPTKPVQHLTCTLHTRLRCTRQSCRHSPGSCQPHQLRRWPTYNLRSTAPSSTPRQTCLTSHERSASVFPPALPPRMTLLMLLRRRLLNLRLFLQRLAPVSLLVPQATAAGRRLRLLASHSGAEIAGQSLPIPARPSPLFLMRRENAHSAGWERPSGRVEARENRQ